MQRNRLFLILLCMTAVLGMFTIKLFSIQLLETVQHKNEAAMTAKSIKQRAREIILNDGRAQLVDRTLEPLTGETIYSVALFPDHYRHFQGNSQNISSKISDILTSLTADEWDERISSLDRPTLLLSEDGREPIRLTKQQADQLNQLQVPGLAAVPITKRYTKPYLASHVIGFLGEHPERVQEMYADKLAAGQMSIRSRIGGAGLEKTLDRWMQGIGEHAVVSYVDGYNRPIFGMSLRIVEPNNPFYPLNFVTTLDKSLQQQVEQLVDQHGLNEGAVVVLDAKSADIVTMVSRPAYDPNHLERNDEKWRNRAVKAAVPGSIFKTITAAAALEYRLSGEEETFECSGHLGKYNFTCWNRAGHGRLTLREAYASSCNITFARLAERLTGEQIVQTARKFGLAQLVGSEIDLSDDGTKVRVLDGEEAGIIFSNPKAGNDEGVRIQSAIGQRDVMISPLQAANMVVTILNDGEVKRPRILKEIRYRTGSIKNKFDSQILVKKQDGISARTAETIRSWMEDVVNYGTAKSLNNLSWNAAGKTGTAQIGNTSKENQWFVGYTPVENPLYAIAVFVEKTDGARGHEATKLFGDIVQILAEND